MSPHAYALLWNSTACRLNPRYRLDSHDAETMKRAKDSSCWTSQGFKLQGIVHLLLNYDTHTFNTGRLIILASWGMFSTAFPLARGNFLSRKSSQGPNPFSPSHAFILSAAKNPRIALCLGLPL